jgi:flavodoxin
MNFRVVYTSKKGNTEKVAESIAKGLNIKAEKCTDFTNFDQDIDLLFLGSSLYFGSPRKEMAEFIKKLNPSKIKTIALFDTNLDVKDSYHAMKEEIEPRGIHVLDEHFHALGHALGRNKGHPDAKELEEAEKFGAKLVKLYFSPAPEPEEKTGEESNAKAETSAPSAS